MDTAKSPVNHIGWSAENGLGHLERDRAGDGGCLALAILLASAACSPDDEAMSYAMQRVSRRPSLGPIDLDSFANGLSMRHQKQ
jgi:hypothetical protein